MVIDSIIVAVNDLSTGIDDFEQQFGLSFGPRHSVPEQHVTTAWAPFGGSSLQLAAPLAGTGPIEKFLRTRGEGISGVTLRVENVVAERERYLAQGLVRPEAEVFDSGYAREIPLRPSRTHGTLFVLREWNQ